MGKLIVLGGPSASGKTLIKKKIIEFKPNIFRSLITSTTRKAREKEIDGIDYYFLSKKEFEDLCNSNQMPEYTEYAGIKYGVSKKSLDEVFLLNNNTIAIMDANGLNTMRKYLGNNNVLGFYINISPSTMCDRLEKRGSSMEEINSRIKKAMEEEMLQIYKDKFDFIINNEQRDIQDVVQEILKIIDN